MPNDKAEKVRNALIKEGYKLPPLDQFVIDMRDSTKLKKVRETLIKEGYQTPDFNTMYTDLNEEPQKEVSAPVEAPVESASSPMKFSAPLGTKLKEGFSVPADKTFVSIPQGFAGQEKAYENMPADQKAREIIRKSKNENLGATTGSDIAGSMMDILNPMRVVSRKIGQKLGVIPESNNEEDTKKAISEFQNQVQALDEKQRSELKSEVENSDLNDSIKKSFLYILKPDVTALYKVENVVTPQETFGEQAQSSFKESTKNYALAAKIALDSQKYTVDPKDVDTFIDNMYNKYIVGVPTKSEKEVAREALGIQQNLSGAAGRAVGYMPAFLGEMGIITAATGGEGAIPRAFEGASTTMKVMGGFIDQSLKMGLQQSVFEGNSFKEGAGLGAAYHAGGLITGSIFGLQLAKKLMANGLSARVAGKTVAAIQSGTGAALGGSGFRLANGEGVDANSATIDMMMGATFGLFHTSPELRKSAIDHIVDRSVESGIVDPADAMEMKDVLFKTTSDAQSYKEIANSTLDMIKKSKGKDFSKVVEQPIEVNSDFPLKNIAEVETEPAKEKVEPKEVVTNEQETQTQKEKGLLNNTDVTESGQKTTGVSETAQTTPIETKPSEVVRVKPNDIQIDESRFQNRAKLDEDVLKQITEKYSDQEMDPVKVWVDPSNGQTYLLAGHHRLEAAKRVGVETIKAERFVGTEAEAIDYATTRSNANRSMESELDRAKIYRKMREAGNSNSEIMGKAEIEGKNKSRIMAFSYLNPDGKTADALKTIPPSSDQYNTVRQIAQWVGETRKMFPEITNSHENEMFDYLVKGGRAIFRNKLEFVDRVDNLVNRIDFNKDQPLNLANRVSKTDIEQEFDQRLAEAQSNFDTASKELNDIRKRAIDQGVEGQALEKALKPYHDAVIIAQKELSAVKDQKSTVRDAAKTQTDIFSAIEDVSQQVEKGKINEQQAETIISDIESEITGRESRRGSNKDAEAVVRGLENLSEGVTDAESARKFREEVSNAITDNFKTEDAIDVGNAIKGNKALIQEVRGLHELFTKEFESDKSPINAYKIQLAREIVEVATETGGWKQPGGGEASSNKYVFNDIPLETNPTLQIHPLQTMEALEILHNHGLVPVVKSSLHNALGLFSPVGNGKIKILRTLLLPGNETQLVKTMFHEIGHWVDWMPDKDLRRGGLGSRLQSMFKATNESLDFKNAVFTKELKQLSKEWRPWDEKNASEKEIKYRNSSKEIYADFISALFNNPGYVKRIAPKSFDTFFKYLDRKPTIKDSYFEIQRMYNNGFESVVAHRDAQISSMFDQHDYKAAELQVLREAEIKRLKKSWTASVSAEIINQTIPLEKLVEKAQREDKKAGRTPNEELRDILPFNRDMNYIDRMQEATVRKIELIKDDIISNDLDWKDVGKLMLYERITKGDRYQMLSPDEYYALTGEMTTNDIRVDLHNPKGLNKQSSQELLNHMRDRLGDKNYAIIEKNVNKMRDLFRDEMQFAVDSGTLSVEKFHEFRANPAYATFRVTEYIDTDITPHFFTQLGTFKDIGNPADQMMLKMLVMRSASIKNRARLANINFMKEYFPEDIVATTKNMRGDFEPVNPEKARWLKPIKYFDNGERQSYYVEEYLHDIMTMNKPVVNNAIQRTFRVANLANKTLMLTLSAGWQIGNHVFMDPFRSWINTPTWNLPKLFKNRLKAYGPSLAYAFNLKKSKHYQESIRLLENEVLGEGFKDMTYETLMQGETPADRHIHEVLANSGIGAFKSGKTKNKYMEAPMKALSFVEQLTSFLDNVAKTQGFYDMSDMALAKDIRPGELRDFVHRNIGTPAFRESGKLSNVINPLMLYASSNIAALSSDMKLATSPKSRAGWWAKVATTIFLPHTLQLAAQYGYQYLSDDQKKNMPKQVLDNMKYMSELFRDIPEYDKTNYICIPMGRSENNRTQYFRIPFDQTSRLMGAVYHKAMSANRRKQEVGELLADVLSDVYGGLPSFNPALKTVADGMQFLSTGNAYNAYTGQKVLSDTEQRAGGWRASKKFLAYTFEQVGGAVFVKPYTNMNMSNRSLNPTPGERVISLPLIGPMVSRFYRESDRGVSEYIKMLTKDMDKKQAEQVLATNDAISVFVQSGKMDGEELIKDLKSEGVDLSDPMEPARIKMKLKAAIIKGEADPFMNALIDAGIEKRILIFQEAKKFMEPQEYLSYLKLADTFGLIPK